MTIKEKTSAKKRYLRRKKDRKKQKTRALKASNLAKNQCTTDSEALGSDEEKSTRTDAQLAITTKLKEIRPAKKKQRVERVLLGPNEVDVNMVIEDSAENARADDASIPGFAEDDTASTMLALPRFPLPVLPDASFKTDLALQGLDQALVEGDLIDPSNVLPVPSEADEDTWLGLSLKMRRSLKELGIQEFFAVQTSVLPFLLQNRVQGRLYMPYNPPRDVCVSAPTGSGKTLAYAVPIVELLSSRVLTRLRALVVLPTRDLVVQVRETFEAISKGHGLKIGSITGQHPFAHEQSQLVADQSPHLNGGSSKVDILICTPGRLIDHLNGTSNFSLQHLRFLVIDEADRLLAQSFQDWLMHVLEATRPSNVIATDLRMTNSYLPSIDSVAPAYHHVLPLPQLPTELFEKRESSCQKLLFSATLTRDPGKIASLGLRDPKYFIIQEKQVQADESGVLSIAMEKFSTPTTLKEHMIVCESLVKPLMFFYLVHVKSVTNALVFTKSAESTTRLVQLFEYFEQSWSASAMSDSNFGMVVRAYSSDLPASERKGIFEKFKSREIQILVCSDLISRGIDVDHVSHVVSYDAPVDIRKYVHRVGRTARAGRQGNAWTLVEEQEARYFKRMLQEAGHIGKVKRVKISEKDVVPFAPHYEVALKRLKDAYTR
ncbi:hypothetical protein APHAL10511_007448 [Amanita phalloides]|nr:hypothetical protein APHAL10511_007448 [Amanita phalloides]